MVHAQTLYLVQRNEHSCEEKLVFFLQGKSETIDDGAENFKELGNSVETLSLVDELEEDVVDRTTNVRAEVEEFTIYTMERRFQKVAFPGVFGVKKLE